MYEQIVLLLSFVYVIALTHILSTTTELILARERVIFSGLQALWMFNALMLLSLNWIAGSDLSAIKHWTPGMVVMQFIAAIMLYFTCSLFSIKVGEHGPIDLPTFFARNRIVIMSAFGAKSICAATLNFLARDIFGNGWITADSFIFLMLVILAVAAFVRPTWLQWVAGAVHVGLTAIFIFSIAFTT